MRDYASDILLWSERQSELLRRHAAGESINDTAFDWPNIIEEIESVGRSELHTVESLLVRALAHMLKADAWPLSREAPHWKAEAVRFRLDAASRFTPSMRQRIDVEKLYRRARRGIPETTDSLPPLPLSDDCPVTLDDLLAD